MNLTPFLSLCASPATASAYRDRLEQFGRWLGERRPTKTVLDAYFAYLLNERKVSNRTAMLYRSTLAHYFDHQKETTGKPKDNPVSVLKLACRESTRQAFTAQEIGRILSACDKAEWYWAPAVVVGYSTGLRLGDIATLSWDEVDIERGVLTVVPTKTHRHFKVVEIPMTDEVSATLGRIKLSHKDARFVFPEMAVLYQWNPAQLSGQFAVICKRANVRGSFHCCRHTFCTNLVNSGANHLIISSMTGHSLAQIKNYCHPSLDAKRAALLTLASDEPRTQVK